MDQLLLQNLGIPDGMTLGIEDDLESGIEIVVLGLGVRMGMVGGWSDVPQGCGSWSGEKWEQNPIKSAHKPRKAIASFRVLGLVFGAEVGGHGSLFGNKMKAMGLLLHKIHLHLYTQTFHKTLEVHGPLRDP